MGEAGGGSEQKGCARRSGVIWHVIKLRPEGCAAFDIALQRTQRRRLARHKEAELLVPFLREGNDASHSASELSNPIHSAAEKKKNTTAGPRLFGNSETNETLLFKVARRCEMEMRILHTLEATGWVAGMSKV